MSDASDFREPHLRRGDFLGAFGVIRRGERILFVSNRRRIGGRDTRTWDLPGGQVEPGELLVEALTRELGEELGARPTGEPEFLFLQEGEKRDGGSRSYAWRSFFFAVASVDAEPSAHGEVLDVAWLDPAEMRDRLTAPYHDSFLAWLDHGGRSFQSIWND
jgi:8-oxo-dGTP diphosphatase